MDFSVDDKREALQSLISSWQDSAARFSLEHSIVTAALNGLTDPDEIEMRSNELNFHAREIAWLNAKIDQAVSKLTNLS
jgi:hypothetical protein